MDAITDTVTIDTADYVRACGEAPAGVGDWILIDSDGCYLSVLRDVDWAHVPALLAPDAYSLCPGSRTWD